LNRKETHQQWSNWSGNCIRRSYVYAMDASWLHWLKKTPSNVYV